MSSDPNQELLDLRNFWGYISYKAPIPRNSFLKMRSCSILSGPFMLILGEKDAVGDVSIASNTPAQPWEVEVLPSS